MCDADLMVSGEIRISLFLLFLLKSGLGQRQGDVDRASERQKQKTREQGSIYLQDVPKR